MKRRLLSGVTIVVAVLLVGTTAAWAAWTIGSANAHGSSKARTMPTATAPTASASGTTVTVSWSAASFPGGPNVAGYVVRAYNATTNASRAVGGTCTGTVTALTCSDTGVSAGGWQYTVQTRQSGWVGPESAKSTTVTVAAPPPTDTTAPTTTDNSATIGAGPHNTNKTVTLTPTDNAGGSGVAATYYTTNGTTPTTSSTQGTSVLLSTDGTYTIKYFSVDVAGNAEAVKTASTGITIDKTAPVPTAVTLVNGGGSGGLGTAARGDRIDVTVSEALAVSSMCSTWSGNATNQALNTNADAVVVTITDNGTNDVLTVSTSTCTFRFGSVALGGNYVSTTRTFSGSGSNRSSITWSPTTRTLSVTLGDASGSVSSGVAAGTPAWTPSSSLTDIAGNAMATTPLTSTTTSRF